MIVWGQGIILGKAEEELKSFVEKSGIPAAWTILGASALSSSHPLNVGMVGMHGNYAPNVLTNECDLLIALGMRFDDRVTGDLSTYAKQAKVIHFEIDPAEINKNVHADVPVLGNVKENTLEEIWNGKKYKELSFVIMDGKFVCIDPYLGTPYHLLSHVKYSKLKIIKKKFSKFPKMCENQHSAY